MPDGFPENLPFFKSVFSGKVLHLLFLLYGWCITGLRKGGYSH